MTDTRCTSREEALALDNRDKLAAKKQLFNLPKGVTYLVGHSLGPTTQTAMERLRETAEKDWAEDIVRGWNTAGWIDLSANVGAKISKLIGAKADEVLICDSVSVNLFKLAVSALPLTKTRRIIIEDDEFPTDQYIAKGMSEAVGAEFHRVGPEAGIEALAQGGVLIKSAVRYRDAHITDMAAYEEAAQGGGGVVIWDLSHATGVIAVDLHGSGARFAAGCTYKYLNGGPGAPAFVYVSGDVSNKVVSPLPGWMGHKYPFAFDKDYVPTEGAARFAAGTPPILSLAALDGALAVFEGVNMRDVQQKAQALGTLCLDRATAMGLQSPSHKNVHERGGHISLTHAEGYPIVQALMAAGIHTDFRAPDTIRMGFSPLYLSYKDVWDAMDALADILENNSWDQPEFRARSKVT